MPGKVGECLDWQPGLDWDGETDGHPHLMGDDLTDLLHPSGECLADPGHELGALLA